MNTSISDDNELITKINEILVDFGTFDKASINDDGSIIIKKKITKRKNHDTLIITNIFKEIMKNDIKKNRV